MRQYHLSNKQREGYSTQTNCSCFKVFSPFYR